MNACKEVICMHSKCFECFEVCVGLYFGLGGFLHFVNRPGYEQYNQAEWLNGLGTGSDTEWLIIIKNDCYLLY